MINQLTSQELVNGPPFAHVLGVKWNSAEDNIGLSHFNPSNIKTWTKRKIFSDIAKVFDAYGGRSHVALAAKLLGQGL